MAHGTAGAALALSRLYAATDDARFRLAAQDAVSSENETFDEEHCNWPDLREDVRGARWPNQWCYGATGIGHARLAMRYDGALPREVLDRDVERAISSILKAPPSANDTLCCGSAGRIDFLIEAGRILHRPELLSKAEELLSEIRNRWALTRDARWVSGTRAFNLGLFQGASGLGVVALRIREPRIPSVLVWG